MQKTKLKAARPQTKKTRLLACQDRVNFQVLFRFPSGQFNNWQCYLLLIYLGTVQLNDFIILRGYPEPPNNHVNFGYPPAPPIVRVNGGPLAIMWNSQKTRFFSQEQFSIVLPRAYLDSVSCALTLCIKSRLVVKESSTDSDQYLPKKISFLGFVSRLGTKSVLGSSKVGPYTVARSTLLHNP